MKKLRWQLLIIFLTGLVVGILLISEQPEPPSVQAPEPQEGGVYVEALIGRFQRLNPVLDFYNPADQDIDRLLYSRLIDFGDRGIPQPELTESYGISQDGTIYNFTLRDNATWHDGSPVISEDVVFTINMLRDGEGIVPEDIRTFWQDIEVVALSDTTLQFRLPEPFAPFLDYLSFGILPSHLLENSSFQEIMNDPFNLNPVGSGPYKFDGFITEDGQIEGVVLSANTEYYGDQPFIDQLAFRYYETPSEGYQAYQNGNVQGISRIDESILQPVLNEPQLSLYTARKPQLNLIMFNLKDQQVAFFQDVEVRKALYYGLNRQKMVDQVFNGQAILADSPILPGTWAYYENMPQFSYDSLKAVQMLKDAGYILSEEGTNIRTKDDLSLRFELLYPDSEEHRQLAEMIQQDWEPLGVVVEIRAVPYNELINTVLPEHSFQAVLIDLNLANTPDPDPYPFWDQVQATGGQNYSQWDNAVASDYLEQARVTTDLLERTNLYRNFQVVFGEEMPALPMFYPVYSFAISNQVQGVQIGPLFNTSDRFETVEQWYLVGPQRPQQTTPTLEVSTEEGS